MFSPHVQLRMSAPVPTPSKFMLRVIKRGGFMVSGLVVASATCARAISGPTSWPSPEIVSAWLLLYSSQTGPGRLGGLVVI
jgi:hypothetical protein